MSLLFFENDSRFKSNGNDESDLSSNTNKSKTNGDGRVMDSKPTVTSKLLKNESTKSCTTTTTINKSKKTTLNQSSSHSISPLVLNDNCNNSNQLKDSNENSKEQLDQFVAEKENHLLNVCNEYDQQYDNFFKIAKKYHIEKLNNLKLQFKNQILKQKIYFETELLEISKECNREYENHLKKPNKPKCSNKRFEKEKQLVKLYKLDMKRLIDYMKEALINSSDTLMEAFETCKVLKSLEQVEKNAQKQNSNLKNSTKNLLSYKNDSNIKQNDKNTYNLTVIEDDDNNKQDEIGKKLTDEQIQFNKYQAEMDELMHVLDDIELQHLQRKDQLTSKTKFINKLKSKFKFIENKYETLNKQITNLKYESYIYKELWHEKQRSSQTKSKINDTPSSSSSSNNKQHSSYYFNSSTKSSTMSSSLSPSASSRSSSTSSLSDCYHDAIDTTNSDNSRNNNNSSSSNTSCSPSSSSSSSSILSEIIDNELDEFDDLNLNDNGKHHDNKSASNSNSKLINNGLSTQDYNRKLNLINNLISLHKAKQSSKDIWTYKNSELTNHINSSRYNYLNDCNNNEDSNNNNNMNENDDIFSNIIIDESDNLISNSTKNSNIVISNNGNFLRNKQNSCSLDLCECSTYGDRVIVENFNLKLDHDISNWYITRQIENMSIINKYRLPTGSIIKSGKVLKINEPFENDQIDFLLAIKQKQMDLERKDNTDRLKKICLKIVTKLVTPEGIVKSIHTQEVPQFYQEIFKYANLIQFL